MEKSLELDDWMENTLIQTRNEKNAKGIYFGSVYAACLLSLFSSLFMSKKNREKRPLCISQIDFIYFAFAFYVHTYLFMHTLLTSH